MAQVPRRRKYRVKMAEREAVEKAATDWTDKVVSCRTYGHQWRPLTVIHDRDGYVIMQRCSSCGNRRECQMDANGFTNGWTYGYQDGYLTKGLGRIGDNGRAALRLASLRFLKVTEQKEED